MLQSCAGRSIHLASSSIEWAGKPENRFLSKISNLAADPPLTGFGHIAAQHKAVRLLLLLNLDFVFGISWRVISMSGL